MKAMDGIVVGSKPMVVRFHELKYPRHPNTTKDAESKPAKGESVDSVTVRVVVVVRYLVGYNCLQGISRP